MEAKETKVMQSLFTNSLRNLVDQVNAYGIQKEDIVHLHSDEEGFILLYYATV